MAPNQEIIRKILIDEPSREDQFRGKGHERTAAALARAITSSSGHDRAIGLDGPWGSGKSTVVEIARNLLAKPRKGSAEYRFFTFDIWQSQGSSFRRSFLEHFLDWTMATFPSHRAKLESIERNVKGKVREVESRNQSILDWWGLVIITAIPFLPMYYFWAKAVFDNGKRSMPYIFSPPMLLLYLFVLVTFGWAGLKCFRERQNGTERWKGFPARYRQTLSQILLISSKQFEDQKVTQYIRETDPNDFEFQTSLRRILSVVQSEKTRAVLVLDNIDRLPRKEINEYWAQVRTVFSNGPSKSRDNANSSVIAIVPYDRHLVEGQQKSKEGSSKSEANDGTKTAAISPLGTREIFSKTFDEILQISPPVMSNSRDFFLEKIRKALPSAIDRDELFRVYLIFDHILRNEKGSATPRQIIAFINELTGIYILHDGHFRLPTVAVYIAHADSLEDSPGILNDPATIDDRLRKLAGDSELEQNLAAIIFNVEPGLALQLLLDNRIKDAASLDANDLLEISNAPGFDLRVDFVIQDSIHEWQQSGVFPLVVSHFADLAKSYRGDARVHFCKSLVNSVTNLGRLSLDAKVYDPLLRIFEIARPEEREPLSKSILTAALNSLPNDDLTLEHGQQWAVFVGRLHKKLADDSASNVLSNAMPVVSFPNSPAFLFGVAASVAQEGLTLSIFNPKKADFSSDESLYSTLAVQRPSEASAALEAFASLSAPSLITEDRLKSIFEALVAQLGSAEVEDLDDFRHQVDLLAEIYAYFPYKKRSDLDVTSLFSVSNFYAKLRKCLRTEGDASLGSVLFLATIVYGQEGPPTPTVKGPNGRVSDQTEDYNWFSAEFTDAEAVHDEQYRRAAFLTKNALSVTEIVQKGSAAPNSQLLAGIVRYAFTEGEIPSILLSNFLKNYGYIRRALGVDAGRVLDRYSVRVSSQEIERLQLAECHQDFIRDIQPLENPQWQNVIGKIKALLGEVPINDWVGHLTNADHMTQVLWRMVDGSQFEFSDPAFREIYVEFVLDLLAGTLSVDETAQYDLLLGSIGKSFHSDMFRQIRERATDVNPVNLALAAKVFPQTLSKMIRGADRLSKEEKDNLVRFFLCPALEGAIKPILSDFEALGHAKVKDMIKQSAESTQDKLDGASKSFSAASADREWTKQVSELLYGKRKSKSLFDIWFGKAGEDD